MKNKIYIFVCIMLCNQVIIGSERLTSQQQKDQSLCKAVQAGQPQTVLTLLMLKGNPNGPVQNGNDLTTPLLEATRLLPSTFLGNRQGDPILTLLNEELCKREKSRKLKLARLTQKLNDMTI